jgi:hypothetical protein
VYTAIYDATDASGNSSLGSVQVSVPHDQGQGKGKGKGNGNLCGGTPPPGTGGTSGGTTGNGHGPKK